MTDRLNVTYAGLIALVVVACTGDADGGGAAAAGGQAGRGGDAGVGGTSGANGGAGGASGATGQAGAAGGDSDAHAGGRSDGASGSGGASGGDAGPAIDGSGGGSERDVSPGGSAGSADSGGSGNLRDGSTAETAVPRWEAGDAVSPEATVGTCSDAVLRTGPPAGKEIFRTEPIDTKFPFSQHWMGTFSNTPSYVGVTSFGDFDRDGDLDFSSGQADRDNLNGGVVWWEYCSADHWVKHAVGTGHSTWAGGYSVDIDADGWVDIIAGSSWYRNPQTPRTTPWQRYPITGAGRPEEIIVGEVTGDTRPDVLFVHNSFPPQYFSPVAAAPGAIPMSWTAGTLNTATPTNQQQGGAIGDMDGDGDNDILVGYRWWYRNMGNGASWQTVNILPANAFDNSPLTYLGDLDGDGDTDIAMATHFGARVAWAENQDGVGTMFALRMIATNKTFLHTMIAADFDNDGDLDLLAANNVGPAFIFENTDGRGTFLEHMIVADSRGHDMRVADVDCDGDLDIAGTPWGDLSEGGESAAIIRDQVYLRNMVVERGGTPLFQRKPHEVFLGARSRVCPGQ